MQTVPVLEGIDWVGHIDWTVRDFHSYTTGRGATYNSYLIRDRQTALIDAVKAPFVEELLGKIASLVPLEKLDYIICNHAEPDHSGGLPKVVAACPNATVVCNKKCREILSKHYDVANWKFKLVETGDSLSLGARTLSFINTPMVHWPDSMFTYVPEHKLLFSMDGFGQHYASVARFDDENPLSVLMEEAKTYYANIVMPYGKQVAKVLEQAQGLAIEIIAPSHGVIWRKHVGQIVSAYQNWCVCKAQPKALVIYDSMWESTARMAEAIIEGATRPGVEVKLIHVRRTDMTFIVPEVLDAAAVAFGSSTLNQTLMPAAAAVLTYLQGLRPQNKAGFAFGSYGWGKGGPEAVDQYLRAMDFAILREPFKCQFRPTPEVLAECRAAGELLAARALEAGQ